MTPGCFRYNTLLTPYIRICVHTYVCYLTYFLTHRQPRRGCKARRAFAHLKDPGKCLEAEYGIGIVGELQCGAEALLIDGLTRRIHVSGRALELKQNLEFDSEINHLHLPCSRISHWNPHCVAFSHQLTGAVSKTELRYTW